ncbi:unnamed protein product [Amoebophrya sp. A25]|nr:unnamed protein product [Amoebophrya sp. A25]|eukprot:GSA25T00027290001.1
MLRVRGIKNGQLSHIPRKRSASRVIGGLVTTTSTTSGRGKRAAGGSFSTTFAPKYPFSGQQHLLHDIRHQSQQQQHFSRYLATFHLRMSCRSCGSCGSETEPALGLRPLAVPDIPEPSEDGELVDPERALLYIKRELAELAADQDAARFFVQSEELRVCKWRMHENGPSRALKPTGTDDTGPWLTSFYVRVPQVGERHDVDHHLSSDHGGATSSSTHGRSSTSHGSCRNTPGVTPFDGETFLVDLRFNATYPELPPQVSFRSSVHHPFLQNEHSVMPVLFYQGIETVLRGGPEQQSMSDHAGGAANGSSGTTSTSSCTGTGGASSSTVVSTSNKRRQGDQQLEGQHQLQQHYTVRNVLRGVLSFLKTGMEQQNASMDRILSSYPEQELFRKNIEQYKPHRKTRRFFEIRGCDDLPDEWLDPQFLAWRKAGYPLEEHDCSPSTGACAVTTHRPDIYSFPMFTMEFCDALVAEVRSIYASGVEVQRPNSMNRYGVILNYIGMEGFMTAIQRLVQQTQLAVRKFGAVGSSWDGHHSFIVQYAPGKDLGLDMHTDDSDVTMNICLGVDFEGSQVAFCGRMGAKDHRKQNYIYEQKKGRCLIHLGRQRHGAVDIKKGERMNLIIWNRSRLWRSTDESRRQIFVPEDGKPDEVCLSYTHDRDYGVFKRYPEAFKKFKGRGWCPPKAAEYPGFVPEN